MKNLRNLFLNELADMYDAEQRLVKALPKIAAVVTCPELKEAILAHLDETKGHVTKVEQVFSCFGEKAKARKCEATAGLLKEGEEIIGEFKDTEALNAGVVSAAQKVEHYEIASYGCLHAWAVLLENEEAEDLLFEILEEEKTANETLTEIANEQCNPEALDGEDDGKNIANGAKPQKKRS